jgi:outer membrane lipoprotein-sorting protein
MHRILITVILAAVVSTLCAQRTALTKSDAARITSYITAASLGTNSIRSDFTQEKELSILSEKIISKGRFYFRKEKLLRWEYTDPFKYLIIINNDQLLVRDESKDNRVNLQTNKVFREVNQIIMGAVRGTLLTDTKNFKASLFDDNSSYLCILVPLNSKLKESLSEIWLWFNKNDYTVDKVDLREASGDYTRIRFTGKQLNTVIGDENFSLR